MKLATHKLALALAAMFAMNMTATAALAGNAQGDLFNRSTGSASVPTPAMPNNPPSLIHSYKAKAAPWFESMDAAVGTHFATNAEQVALTRPFGSKPQLERVIEWTNTAAAVSKKYRDLARILRAMPLSTAVAADPAGADVDRYKHDLADWYDDAAEWLEDYIRPRQPARTIEELNDQLKSMQSRSDILGKSMAHLQKMDSDLRSHFGVDAPKYDNAILKFASRVPEKH